MVWGDCLVEGVGRLSEGLGRRHGVCERLCGDCLAI